MGSSNTVLLKCQRQFLYDELNDLMSTSTYSELDKNRIYGEFKQMLERITDMSQIVQITDYILLFEGKMDTCVLLETILQQHNKGTTRKGKAFIRKER